MRQCTSRVRGVLSWYVCSTLAITTSLVTWGLGSQTWENGVCSCFLPLFLRFFFPILGKYPQLGDNFWSEFVLGNLFESRSSLRDCIVSPYLGVVVG